MKANKPLAPLPATHKTFIQYPLVSQSAKLPYFHVLEEPIDDVEVEDFDSVVLGECFDGAGDSEVEAVDEAFEGGGQINVRCRRRPDAEIHHVTE